WLASDASPVAKYTPKGWPTDGVFDVRGIIQQSHFEVDWFEMPDFLKPKVGKHALTDYEKCFAAVEDTDRDIFDMQQIDRGQGALVVVRPDQYVSQVLPLDAFDELSAFFAGFMTEA
ncbi:MAG: 3-hydroxybenzoate 4-monooxygenase, partial [Propionibacteriaceae bacterium]|nr:3-hydroxybenzoate 4-monooxygenase [Propionibacteriaceae bacterium]